MCVSAPGMPAAKRENAKAKHENAKTKHENAKTKHENTKTRKHYEVLKDYISIYQVQVVPGRAGGRSFKREKNRTINQRKNLPIECAQGDRPAPCPNHFFAVNEPSAVPWW